MNTGELRLRAMRHLEADAPEAALLLLDEWLASVPDAFEPQFLKIRALLSVGRIRPAMHMALALKASADCPPTLVLSVFRCLRYFAVHDRLVEWGETYCGRESMTPEDTAEAAAELAAVGAYDAAWTWIEDALLRHPDSPALRIGRALLHTYWGRVESARKDLVIALRRPESRPMALWLLTRLERQTPKRNHVLDLRRLLPTLTDPGQRAMVGHALFKTYDDLGEIDAAWAALSRACHDASTRAPYSAADTEAKFAAVRDSARLDAAASSDRGAEPIPIFVVGMHRSGTTLVERLLAASQRVRALGETRRLTAALRSLAEVDSDDPWNPHTTIEACRRGVADLGDLFSGLARIQTRGYDFATDKMPDNFMGIGFIRAALPWSKIVHVRREPLDLCFANLREYFRSGVAHGNSFAGLAHYHACYLRLMAFWREAFPGFIHEVDYEALVADPEGESRRLYTFVGLEWSPSVLSAEARGAMPVSTLSAIQVRQPIHLGSIGRWRRYERHLGPLIGALAAP